MSTFCSPMTTPFHRLISLFSVLSMISLLSPNRQKYSQVKATRDIRSDKAEKPAKGKGDGFCVLLTKGPEVISPNP